MLWQRLSDCDKGDIAYSQRYRDKPHGRFKASKSTVTPGEQTTKTKRLICALLLFTVYTVFRD